MNVYMTLLVVCCIAALAFASPSKAVAASPESLGQTIIHNGSQPSVKGPAEFFTGTVRIDYLFPAKAPTQASGAYVTFEPGARSAWHVHPVGQKLIVTAGRGLTQQWGGPVQEIHAGDVVICPAKVKHWHGASPTTAMTHIAITEEQNGKNVEWMEKVTDAQYSTSKGGEYVK